MFPLYVAVPVCFSAPWRRFKRCTNIHMNKPIWRSVSLKGKMAFSTMRRSGAGHCLSHWMEVDCNINNIIWLKAVLPPQASPTMIQERWRIAPHQENCLFWSSSSQTLENSESSSVEGTASSHHGRAFACAYWLLRFGGSVLVCTLQRCLFQQPFLQGTMTSRTACWDWVQTYSQFFGLELWCINSVTAGIVSVWVGWASSDLLQEGCNFRSFNSFFLISTQKNIIWRKPMFLSYGNQENLNRK